MLGNGFMAFQHRNSMIVEFFIRKLLQYEKVLRRSLSQMTLLSRKGKKKYEFIDKFVIHNKSDRG